jgi:RNA recognition motif-containing protein
LDRVLQLPPNLAAAFSAADHRRFELEPKGRARGNQTRREPVNQKQRAEKRTVFIGGLSYQATEQDLREAAESVGLAVANTRVALERETGRSRGFGFIDLAESEPKTLGEAVDLMDGLDFYGRACRAGVAEALPERPRNERRRGSASGNNDGDKRPHKGNARGRRGGVRSVNNDYGW